MTIVTATETDRRAELEEPDQYVRLHGVSWQDYERLLAIRGERSVPRITYLQGELELMGPSPRHENVTRIIEGLLYLWAVERNVPLRSFGSTTWRKRRAERGVEADVSYVLGTQSKKRPDLAIEVVVTSGGMRKLDVYRGLGVPEVWFWRRGRFTVHVLHGLDYEPAPRSRLLPEADLEFLARLVDRRDPVRAGRLLRRLLRRH